MTASGEIHPVVGYDGTREGAATMGRRGANPVIARRMESPPRRQRRDSAAADDDEHRDSLTRKKA